MTERSRVFLGSVRATTGLLITAITATAVVIVAGTTLPEVTTDPVGVTVDTSQTSQRTLVCQGSFAEIGLDPENPEGTTLTGSVDLVTAGESEAADSLATSSGGSGSAPAVRTGQDTAQFGAAQSQRVSTDEVAGTAASACAEPVNEQWVVGGDTLTGTSTMLTVGNPGDVPATVRIQLFDEAGPVEAGQTTGVLVQPHTERTVSLNGYAPDQEQIVARVVSTGATVTAGMTIGQTVDIDPFSAGSVTRQLDPETRLVIPGVLNRDSLQGNHSGDAADIDEFGVIVRALAPGEEGGTATVRAVDENGKSYALGELALEPGVPAQLVIDEWPERANGVIIDSDVPIVGGAMGSVDDEDRHDNAWFTPSPALPAGEAVAAPVVEDGELVLANPGEADATVRVEKPGDSADDDAREIEIPGGATVVTEVKAGSMLRSDDSVHAAVRVSGRGALAGYPILPISERDQELTVYTR